jgi:membrane associated rhomboid family serine protease
MSQETQVQGLLRKAGVFTFIVAAARLMQVFGFGGSSALGRLTWMIAAAAVAGAGTGLIYTSVLRRTA